MTDKIKTSVSVKYRYSFLAIKGTVFPPIEGHERAYEKIFSEEELDALEVKLEGRVLQWISSINHKVLSEDEWDDIVHPLLISE